MADDVHWSGSQLVGLERSIRSADGRVSDAVVEQISLGGDRVAKRAKALAPRRSGRMRRSISATVIASPTGVRSEIGPSRYWGRFVEHGTSRMAAHPFLGPALDAEKDKISSAVLDAAAEAMGGE